MNLEKLKNNLESKQLEVIDFYRGIVLDLLQQELEGCDDWHYLRSRLLKAFGDRGLAGRLKQVLIAEFSEASNG
ncbi:MAG: hypothetical protein NT027_15135 [Proteobacteria bacterium]|nr:hypothetical protein [Pseudomonadota bacterium]